MRRLIILLFFVPFVAYPQSNYAPLNEDYYHLIDRYEIKAGKIVPLLFTSIKPYKRSSIIDFIDTLKHDGVFITEADQFNEEFLRNDSWEWSNSATNDSRKPVLKHFFKKKSDFFFVHNDEFDLHVNPVIYFGLGDDSRRTDLLFTNTRGVEVRGMVDEKVGFYTYLTDNQAVLPSYVWEQMGQNPVVPHEGFWKEFKDARGVDFLQARGYITYDATKHIHLQLGHDRFFIGNGFRSLALSDFSSPSMFLRGNVQVWKVNYFFLINQMVADVAGNLGGLKSVEAGYPNKFSALHHISINIGKKLNLGIFESVVFSADDSVGSDHLRLDYFNPIIFYRAVEQQNGSSDNVLLGLDFKWNALKHLQLYGQFLLDEFVLDNIRDGNGWWANKFGIQLGGKYIDAFTIPNLDLQGEINIVRPYTYSHNTNYGNYTHYRQPLAHPLGANFREMVGLVRYQPVPRLQLTGKLIMIRTGRDASGENWGGDVLKNNRTRMKEYNNEISQGNLNDIFYGSFAATWMFKHNLFIDATAIIRKSKSELALYDNNTSITSLALRWNIPKRLYEF
jgi:hypothetical protein